MIALVITTKGSELSKPRPFYTSNGNSDKGWIQVYLLRSLKDAFAK